MYATGRTWSESRIRENRTYGSMRGSRKRVLQIPRLFSTLRGAPWSLQFWGYGG